MRSVIAVCVVGVIAALSAVPVGAASHQTCTPTASDGGGGAGGGPDRAFPPLRAKIGTGHVLTGVVLSPACTPIAGARVSFWQSNANGVYSAAGTGSVKTTKSGRFRFEGPRPRSGHIHIRVDAPGFEPLYTEYEYRGGKQGTVRLVVSSAL
jgi:protocatechuate 3,4-dioxygenase beta subunit